MSQPFVGQIIAVGFNFAPAGWALCQGQLLSISENRDPIPAHRHDVRRQRADDLWFAGPSRARRARRGPGTRVGVICSRTIGRGRVGDTHRPSDRGPYPWAVGGGDGDDSDPFVVRRSRHARRDDADLRDGRNWRDAGGGGRVCGPGRRTSTRKPAAEPDDKLHHQPLRGVSVTELNRRRRGGRRAHGTLCRPDHPFSVFLRP